jgi:hypothetical protein
VEAAEDVRELGAPESGRSLCPKVDETVFVEGGAMSSFVLLRLVSVWREVVLELANTSFDPAKLNPRLRDC